MELEADNAGITETLEKSQYYLYYPIVNTIEILLSCLIVWYDIFASYTRSVYSSKWLLKQKYKNYWDTNMAVQLFIQL